jgi:hypothetical protein
MSRAHLTKTSFTAGELDPRLLGRLDLKAQDDGASRLRNVLVQATGGVTRRPGTLFVANLPDARRLVSFDGPAGGELIALSPFRIDILAAGTPTATVASPWSIAQLPGLVWARLGDRLLICHPEVQPQELVREGVASWLLRPWAFERADDGSTFPATHQPYARFVPADVAIQATHAGTPAASPIPAGAIVTVVTSAPVFSALHMGVLLRIKGREVLVNNVQTPSQAIGLVLQELPNGFATRSWEEQAFSPAHGWPASLTFHQDRLVVGGSRDLPDQLWFSRTGRPFNFDLGAGLDDEGIAFRLSSDRLHVIKSLFAGRQLQVFTTAGEWVVKGFPLTPTNVQVELQTRIGSLAARTIPPIDVDGATLFVAGRGQELREFLFADTEQAYQAADIALLSRHLMHGPVDLAFDQRRRLCLVVRQDGALAAVTIDRNSNVAAWALQTTRGRFLAVASHAGEVWLLAERDGGICLERLDEAVLLDSTRMLDSPTPTLTWSGLGHLEGAEVDVVADGTLHPPATVNDGSITLATPARHVTVGLRYAHEVEALPVMAATAGGLGQDTTYRPVRVTFRVLGTKELEVDSGMGLRPVPLPDGGAVPFTGDAAMRALGWRRGIAEPPWRVRQDRPFPCTILSVTTDIKVND